MNMRRNGYRMTEGFFSLLWFAFVLSLAAAVGFFYSLREVSSKKSHSLSGEAIRQISFEIGT